MKQLICEQDIRKESKRGVKEIVVQGNTLVTAAAQDAAQASGIKLVFSNEGKDVCCACANSLEPEKKTSSTEIDPELIYRAVRVMAQSGTLKNIIDAPSVEDDSHCSTTGK